MDLVRTGYVEFRKKELSSLDKLSGYLLRTKEAEQDRQEM